MVDRGPLLTSAIIFYLAIGAAIFEVLEEPHWKEAKTNYYTQKLRLLKEFPCLGQEGLDKILQVESIGKCEDVLPVVPLFLSPNQWTFPKIVSDAAGQGVAITGNQTFNNWNWPNAMIFAATVITTIGVNPSANYHALYRYFVELWIYLGLAWLSLFVNWKVSMFVEVHKAIKKRRRRRKESFESSPHSRKALQVAGSTAAKDINIFSFLSKKEETYNDLIKQIGKKAMKTGGGGERIPGPGPQGGGLPALPSSLAPLAVYSKNRVPSLEEVSQTLRSKGHISRPPGEEAVAGGPKEVSPTSEVSINQLDRISEEGEPWDAQDYHPLIFQNANITFVSAEASLSDEETSKSSLEDNLAQEERPQEGAVAEAPLTLGEFPSSDESTFTSTESELSVPYEQLMNEYNKASGPQGT
ncbi:potassium channel subfamily K member 5 isoform X3 [Phacochoerus africanus]|uniref:potassium channel subfamily K member 5 isoform X3 n=1 Tax=Phacochoerus africanus TaxID=41426 RepID=UPI001FDA29BF|nr:potassium channel subfamily K member 5 isoform X3 [Phacochoerus africanus]